MPYTAYAMVVGTGDADHGPGHYFAVASVNVGLATGAFNGKQRKKHPGRIEQLVNEVDVGRPRHRLLRSGRLL